MVLSIQEGAEAVVGINRDQIPMRRCFTNARKSGHPFLHGCRMEANRFSAQRLSWIEILLANPEEPQFDLSDDNKSCSRARFRRASTRQLNAWLNGLHRSIGAVHGQ